MGWKPLPSGNYRPYWGENEIERINRSPRWVLELRLLASRCDPHFDSDAADLFMQSAIRATVFPRLEGERKNLD
jgi:hypothetical protein